MTNLDKIRAMGSGELATNLLCPYYSECCMHKDENIDCETCKIEWLNTVVEEQKKPEPPKPKIPSMIDRPNFENQLKSYSIKAIVQQMNYLSQKINEVLAYLRKLEEQK